ncbi:MAG: OmpA family protein [Candidatus Melainabacteria bacterium]|nr:OmpA family protein [Candidatus Melainabacteria bacterium]
MNELVVEQSKMKIKYLAALVACTVAVGAAFDPAFAQDVKKINKWFEDIDKNYPNLRKKAKVGDLQTPGKMQTPGKFQHPANIQAPQGFKAIKTTSAPCSQRFLVGADTLFEFDKATLTPRAEETLSVLGPMIQNAGAHPVTIEGHTDAVGTDDYNQQLSDRRAERVRNWLLEHKVVERRAVFTVGYGEKKPVAPNTKPDGKDNPAGRALNRRVEIVVDTCKGIDEPAVTATPAAAPAAAEPPAGTAEAPPAEAPPSESAPSNDPPKEASGDSAK